MADAGPTPGVELGDCALPPPSGEVSTPTPVLAADALRSTVPPEAPVDAAAFRVPEGAGPPRHLFAGHLTFARGWNRQIRELRAADWVPDAQRAVELPAVSLGFTQCGVHLVPERRGRITTSDDYWDLFVTPGITWSTDHDDGMSRATIPFALAFKATNCLQNGLMTFLYDDTTVSDVRYQVTQETCPFHVFDVWGQTSAEYSPEPIERADAVRNDFLVELAHRFTVRPWDHLATDHIGVDLDALDAGITVDEQTSRAILIGDVLYLDRCPTRHGDSPLCENVLFPAYSLTKTLHLGLVTAAIAQELAVDPYEVELVELLPDAVAASGEDWLGVTVEHLLDMTTGRYRFPGQADDYPPGFFADNTLATRIAAALSFPYQLPPGERTVYLTPNYQLAAAALDALLVRENAAFSDSFEMAVTRIYRPAGVTADSFTTLRTSEDGEENAGTAFGGYGMQFTPQGLARLMRFVLDGAVVDGTPVLRPERLAETMFEDPDDVGAPMNYFDWSYHHGMWGYPLDRWGCSGHVPVMFGISGITAIFAPNEAVYFAVNDRQEQPVVAVLDQLDAIAPLCPD